MNRNEHLNGEAVELKPLVGLLHDLPTAMIEQLTVEAIHIHRDLVEKAESRYQALPDEIRHGHRVGGEAHHSYVQSMIAMHAQMSALTTMLHILGYIPKMGPAVK